jgi:hypothetical protein
MPPEPVAADPSPIASGEPTKRQQRDRPPGGPAILIRATPGALMRSGAWRRISVRSGHQRGGSHAVVMAILRLLPQHRKRRYHRANRGVVDGSCRRRPGILRGLRLALCTAGTQGSFMAKQPNTVLDGSRNRLSPGATKALISWQADHHRPSSRTIPSSEKDRRLGPVVREYILPNGGKIISLRPETFRSAVAAANTAIRQERSGSEVRIERVKRT